jgi:hypothetical protein
LVNEAAGETELEKGHDYSVANICSVVKREKL